MDYSLLKEIIQYMEVFQKQGEGSRIEDFVIWLNNQLFTDQAEDPHSEHDELLIAFKVMYLNKELKKQAKSILSASGISSIDEYSFLLHLDYQDSFRKMEIVELHNLEAPTGIEIIKRLLRNKLVLEFPDEQDKRAKRIKITKAGKQELRAIKPKMDSIFTKFTAPLSLGEKIKISGILDQLIK